MSYGIGFLIWAAIALVIAFAVGSYFRRTPGTTMLVAVVLGVLGTFVGGMLGVSGYIYHDPNPMRLGGIIGAVVGGLFFTSVYFLVARKLV